MRTQESGREPDLQSILAAMTDLVFAFDAEGRFIFYHAPRTDDLYVPPERFLGKSYTDVLPPHVQREFSQAWEKARRGEVSEFEYPLEIGGQERWFSAKLSPVLQEGRFAGAVTVIRDLTERRRAEEAQHLADEILRQLNNLVLVANDRGEIVYASPAARRILGYEPEELLGDGWWRVSREDPQEAAREKEHVARQARGEKPIATKPYERAIRHRSGEIRWILWTESKGPGNTIIGVGYDITERRSLVEQLAESEARYRDLFENANDAIYTLDRRGRFTSFNRRAEELTGFSRHEILGKPYHRVIPQRERPKARRSFLKNLRGESDTFELVLQRKDGAEIVVELSTRPLWHEGEVVGVQGIARDITERVELERMKSEFVSLVSHELRTPLTSIKGYTDLLLAEDAGPLTDTQREFLQIIAQNTERLTGLINDLLEIERLEAGRTQLSLAPLDLREVLEEVARTFKVNAEDKGLQFAVELPGTRLPVEGDRDALVRVFSNLVSNAIKYTPQGSVTLRAFCDDARNEVVVEVADTGIGIAPEEREKIFEKFYRASDEYARRIGGTGLGLAIVRALVEQHQGAVAVESALGRGSTFTVRLPLVRTPPSEPSPEEIEGIEQRPLVLVVDDEPDIARLIETYIRRMGYRTILARTGREALQKARELRPDLITLDVLLPDMDGFRALTTLKRDPRTREIPVVFISIVQDEHQGLRLGACAYLPKPLDEERLRSVLRRFLPHPGREAETVSSLPVLVVDDDPDYARLLQRALEREGYRVDIAQDGEEALDRISKRRYQLVLLDQNLPRRSGLEVLRQLRADPTTRDLPVVLISGFTPAEEVQREVEILGARKFLSKKLSLRELVREIDRVLTRISERKTPKRTKGDREGFR